MSIFYETLQRVFTPMQPFRIERKRRGGGFPTRGNPIRIERKRSGGGFSTRGFLKFSTFLLLLHYFIFLFDNQIGGLSKSNFCFIWPVPMFLTLVAIRVSEETIKAYKKTKYSCEAYNSTYFIVWAHEC